MRIFCFHKQDQCDLFEKLSDIELKTVYEGAKQEMIMRRLISKDNKAKEKDIK